MGEARRKLKALENTPVKIQIGRSADGQVVRVLLDRLARYIDFDPDSAVRFAQHLVMVAKPLPMEGQKDGTDAAGISDGSSGVRGDAGSGQGVVADAASGGEVRPDADPA